MYGEFRSKMTLYPPTFSVFPLNKVDLELVLLFFKDFPYRGNTDLVQKHITLDQFPEFSTQSFFQTVVTAEGVTPPANHGTEHPAR